MIPTTQDADHFKTTTGAVLGRVRAGILDLIDVGPTDGTVVRRAPSHREIADTERATSSDGLMDPTPKSQSRRSGGVPSDPVGRAVVAWESEVQQAVTGLFSVVTAVEETVHSLALNVAVPVPTYPATRTTRHGTVIADEASTRLRIRTLQACAYLQDAADQLADRMIACNDPDIGDHLNGQTRLLSRELGRLAARVAPDRVRRCAEPTCGGAAPPVGQGATCQACRKRRSRARTA